MTRVRCVLAPNPGPFTLEGTNTWLVGGDPCLVIDPGPEDRGHLEAVAGRAGRIGAILLTHHHPDHAPGAAMLAELSGAPVLAFGPWPGEGPLEDGRIVTADGVALRVLHTPGHSRDHAAFHDPGAETLFTGDSVLGRGTSRWWRTAPASSASTWSTGTSGSGRSSGPWGEARGRRRSWCPASMPNTRPSCIRRRRVRSWPTSRSWRGKGVWCGPPGANASGSLQRVTTGRPPSRRGTRS